MNKIRYRNWQALMFLMTFTVFFISFFLQYRLSLEPCPLCLMQRLCAGLFGFCCIISVRLRTQKWAKKTLILQMIFVVMGAFFAARQLWLQSLPSEQASACMPALEIMVQYFPLHTILKTLLWGSASCSEVTWTWWGLSMAAWSLIYFSVIFLMCCGLLQHLNRSSSASN